MNDPGFSLIIQISPRRSRDCLVQQLYPAGITSPIGPHRALPLIQTTRAPSLSKKICYVYSLSREGRRVAQSLKRRSINPGQESEKSGMRIAGTRGSEKAVAGFHTRDAWPEQHPSTPCAAPFTAFDISAQYSTR